MEVRSQVVGVLDEIWRVGVVERGQGRVCAETKFSVSQLQTHSLELSLEA